MTRPDGDGDPATVDTDSGSRGADDDVLSDPAEWAGEGGATDEGPSTDVENG